MSASAQLSALAEQVRRLDRDRFGTVLFAPPERREDLFALYAFNSEVSRIRELVHEPLLGRIRLQWWRDTLDEARSGGKPAHPTAVVLGEAALRHSLSAEPFEQLLAARERDMEAEPPKDATELLAYVEGAAGALNVIALEILGIRDPEPLSAARSVGIAWGLTGLLRAVPFHAGAGRSYLPTDLLAERGLVSGDVLAGRRSPGLSGVAEVLADMARRHLAEARRRTVPRAALPGLLTATLAESYLRALAKSGFDLFEGTWSTPRPQPLRLGWAVARGRF
ncbi:phytoene/squalene synthase family protein [Telmatospirillum siberiense]|uniref:Squalene/phytoene synthase family protein n=1 Tax=Telmatospirillum siberiense TaxID=382514 RepID=A0A2N3PTV7_9PROT|nr:phytoene/squalene synthase family protein [Telmatospirillum siberiense]PKU23828.1 squalene/phytoene synthase family protein [Telmatospirillum siberiense]